MDINVLRGLIAVASLVVFLGIVLWAWSGRQRKRFEEAARLPFDEGDQIKAAATIAEERQADAGRGGLQQRQQALPPEPAPAAGRAAQSRAPERHDPMQAPRR